MDEFEKAIICCFNPHVTEDIKQKALAYTESIKVAPDAWLFCLERLGKTQTVLVKFFCLQVFQEIILHRYETLSKTDRLNLRTGLMNWFRLYLVNNPEESSIKNKYAQVMVLLFKQEYLENWLTFFDEFLSMLSPNNSSIDIFLRICKSIDEEVVSFDVHRSPAELAQNTFIKDTMRESAITKIVASWYEILVHHQSSSLINMTLQNIKTYVGWIDISLIVNDKFIPLFCKYLGVRVVRDEVCDCFKEIINKGMDPFAKLTLIQQLEIKNIINFAQLDDQEFNIRVGALINLTGMEILRSLESIQTSQQEGLDKKFHSGEALLEDMLQLLFQFFNNESNDVSYSVYGLASLYVQKLKNIKVLNEKQIQHITLLVQIVRNKMRYKTSRIEEDEDSDIKFADFRKDLSNLFRNIFRICPEMVGSFIATNIQRIVENKNNNTNNTNNTINNSNNTNTSNNNNTNNINTNLNKNTVNKNANINNINNKNNNSNNNDDMSFSDIEVSIYLLFQMGEGISATSEETLKSFEKFFGSMVVVLSQSSISITEHQVVSLIYFETIVRYAKYIPLDEQQYLSSVLKSFLDERGIHNKDALVRSKAGYLLSKLAKQLKVQMFPYINDIIDALKNHLIISYEIQKEVPFEEQLNFYESLGFLIGGASLPIDKEQLYIEKILKNPIAKMEEIIGSQSYKGDTKDNQFYYTVQLNQLISVIGTFSKGFSSFNATNGQLKPDAYCNYKVYFKRSLESIIQLPSLIPGNEEIKSKTFFYMHRMVEVLGKDLKPLLVKILPILLDHATTIDTLLEFLVFYNQLIAKYKEELFDVINPTLRPIIDRIYQSLNTSVPPVEHSDEERALNELKKSYFQLIQALFTHNLASTLTSALNLSLFQQIFNTVISGCQSSGNSESIQKVCFIILKKMIDDYSPGGPHAVNGFQTFIYDQLVPICFQVPLSEQFNMSDFTSNLILSEIGKSLRAIAQKYGDEFLNYMNTILLPKLNVPQEVINQFIKLLQPSAPIKDFQELLKLFIRQKKGLPIKTSNSNININNNNNNNNNTNNNINNGHINGNGVNKNGH
ncbi:hypothetical protein RB653_001639 [Dictyostelium firmibasis]|uniref:Exportin-T n=1 Tax=Dictyostelium firmibasis TaxID=79012 RepID=A0AAN7YYV2_9MYCE